ncbi:MAG TPA: hypothetical protein VL485_07995 [Ktedonobacteraceae bacterium]|jgi:hypothetical protein|nr:hypothetical protein [Ktedonobacteraceae bacterium]
MHLLHSRNSWYYSISFDIMIDFCIWALQVDGLHVPPFDKHPNGNNSLRDAGLSSADWQAWLLRVLHQQSEFKQTLQLQASVDLLKDLILQRSPAPHYPPSVWNGRNTIRERLLELWEQYGPISNQRKRQEPAFARRLRKEEQKSGKRLYDELRPYYKRIPPLSIYLVAYEQPLDCLVLPSTLLMTQQEGQPEPEEFRERVLAAAEELVIQPNRRRRTSPYTSVSNGDGQFAFAYREYTRKPVPPPPLRQEIPRLTDPARQIVLDKLGGEHTSYGIVNLATLQFLREKNRPGWRLYEVTFQEIDGEQHRTIVMLQQNENGSWRCLSISSSSDLQNQWSKIFPPVHDHPLLFLDIQGGGSTDHQYFFHAKGDVIDNGFHVKRVRLVTSEGQVFEDTVEDGLVFFAYEQKQPIPLPMQAELYNDKGELVWRQTVPDDGSPPWLKGRRR